MSEPWPRCTAPCDLPEGHPGQPCTPQKAAARAEKVAAFRAYLDELDEQTRSPGEPPLREAVAQQARERLSEMECDHYWQRNGEGTA